MVVAATGMTRIGDGLVPPQIRLVICYLRDTMSVKQFGVCPGIHPEEVLVGLMCHTILCGVVTTLQGGLAKLRTDSAAKKRHASVVL